MICYGKPLPLTEHCHPVEGTSRTDTANPLTQGHLPPSIYLIYLSISCYRCSLPEHPTTKCPNNSGKPHNRTIFSRFQSFAKSTITLSDLKCSQAYLLIFGRRSEIRVKLAIRHWHGNLLDSTALRTTKADLLITGFEECKWI